MSTRSKDKNSDLSMSIILWRLWIVMLSLLIVITFVGYKVGEGRWECVETHQYMVEKCPKDIDHTQDKDVVCSRDYKIVCEKEVWTRQQ